MRIGIDIRCLIGGKQTGVEEYVKELLEHLFTEGKEHYFVLFWSAWKLPDCPFDWEHRFPNVRLAAYRIPNKLLNFSLWYIGYPRIDRLLGGIDVFFVPNLNFLAVSKDIPVVLTAHDLSFERYPETFSFKRRLWHTFVGFRRLARRANRIIAVSQSTADDVGDLLPSARKKMVVVRSGMATRFHPMSRNDPALLAVKERYHLPYRSILFLGTIEPRKNIESLAMAFDVLVREGVDRGVDLVIAGSPGWKSEDILTVIDRLPSRDRIHLIGYIRDEDKPALYCLTTVFAFPSLYEGFGFPALEAIACGVPTIASDTSSFPEILGDAALLIDPLRPDDLVRALRELLSDRDLAIDFSRRGPERARRYTWKETAKKTLRVLERTVDLHQKEIK